MTSTLLAAAVLSTLVLSGQARASETPPAYAPIQITQSGNLVAQIKVAPAAIPKNAPAKVTSAANDAASAAKEKQAEADFKSSKTIQIQPAKPAVVAEKPVVVVVTAPVAPKASVAKAVIAQSANNAQLPSVPSQRNYAAHPMDGAGLLTARCASLKKHALKCINLEITKAETELDSAEVKLMNCAQIRKFDREVAPASLDAFVVGRMYQLRFKATQAFNAEMATAGRANRMKTHEIELRATLNHLNAARSLASKVCSAPKFKALYAQALTESASK